MTAPPAAPNVNNFDAGVVIDYHCERKQVPSLELGDNARLRSGTILYEGSSIGDNFQTGHNVIVREECTIGANVSIWSNTVIDYGCVIGDNVKIHTNIYVAQFTIIEDGAFLAPGVSIANDLYPGDDDSAEVMAGPIIEAGAQIGVGVTLLPYVRIGAGSIIGSGSVVSRDIPPGVVAFGNPARVNRKVADLPPVAERETDHPLR
ncbi:MAG: acyltransferase [Acidimicrobiales bacterium]